MNIMTPNAEISIKYLCSSISNLMKMKRKEISSSSCAILFCKEVNQDINYHIHLLEGAGVSKEEEVEESRDPELSGATLRFALT